MELDAALRRIHRPDTMAEYHQARRRLAFDEALGVQLVLAQRRHANAANPALARPRIAGGLVDAFDRRLPFEFTGEQRQIAALIEGELAAAHPMHRLLQGEVGSGKTVLALRAMLQVVDAGGPGGAAGAHRGAGRPARAQRQRPARRAGPGRPAGRLGAGHPGGVADRVDVDAGPPGGAARAGLRRGRDRDRHPCPDPGPGAVRRAGPGGHRRAAPLRRGAARCPAQQGRRAAAPAGDDRHARSRGRSR